MFKKWGGRSVTQPPTAAGWLGGLLKQEYWDGVTLCLFIYSFIYGDGNIGRPAFCESVRLRWTARCGCPAAAPAAHGPVHQGLDGANNCKAPARRALEALPQEERERERKSHER